LSDILFYDFEGDVVVFAVDDDDSVVLQSKHSMIKMWCWCSYSVAFVVFLLMLIMMKKMKRMIVVVLLIVV